MPIQLATTNLAHRHNGGVDYMELNPGGEDTPQYITPLLSALADSPEAIQYYQALIKPLEQYDLDHSSNLVGTLARYLYHSGNVTHASAALYLHRSTLLHRLGRISSLTSLDLSDPHVRLALWIAVILKENP
jgi:DNA-binding PucR family transcriptional regulator